MQKAPLMVLLTVILCAALSLTLAQEIAIYAGIGVTSATIENLTINPLEATENQDVDFTVTLKNTGEVLLYTRPGSKVEILSGENLIATLNLYPPRENLAPNDTLDLIVSWNTGTNPPGNYRARATVYYDNSYVQREENFTIIAPAVPPPEAVPPKPEIPVEEWLKLNRLPVVFEFRPGESKFSYLSVLNQSLSTISGIEVQVAGIPENWVSIVPTVFSLAAGETRTLNVTLTVPSDAQPGDYGLQITVVKAAARAEVVSVVRVKPYPSGYAKPNVTRMVTLDREAITSTVSLHVQNGNTFVEVLEVIEEIPKSLAENVYVLSFDITPTEILEPDPVVKWVLENLEPYETRTISYSIARILPDYTSYAYWPVQQISVVYERPTVFFKVVNLVTPTLVVGENGVVRVSLMNMNTRAMNVVVSLSLPSGWVCAPEQLSTELSPRDAAEFSFSITSPPGIDPGLYLGELRATYEGRELTQSLTFSVVEKPSPPFQLWDYVPYLAALGCVAVVGVVVLKWPRKVYREKIVKLLKRIKREASEKG